MPSLFRKLWVIQFQDGDGQSGAIRAKQGQYLRTLPCLVEISVDMNGMVPLWVWDVVVRETTGLEVALCVDRCIRFTKELLVALAPGLYQ